MITDLKCSKCSHIDEDVHFLNIESLMLHLRIDKCPRCKSQLVRVPSTANFKVQNGTEKFNKRQ